MIVVAGGRENVENDGHSSGTMAPQRPAVVVKSLQLEW